MSTLPYGLQQLESAIFREENSSYPNNPGAIMEPSTGLPNTYSTYQDGVNAESNMLTNIINGGSAIYSPDESLQDFATTYTGGNENTGSTIASIIGDGITPNSSLRDIANLNGSQGQTENSSSLLSGLGNLLASPFNIGGASSLAGVATSTVATKASNAGQSITSYFISQILSSRVSFFLLGFICIGGGILLLKSTQTVIQTVGNVAKVAAV